MIETGGQEFIKRENTIRAYEESLEVVPVESPAFDRRERGIYSFTVNAQNQIYITHEYHISLEHRPGVDVAEPQLKGRLSINPTDVVIDIDDDIPPPGFVGDTHTFTLFKEAVRRKLLTVVPNF